MCVYNITDHYSECIETTVCSSLGKNHLAGFLPGKASQQLPLAYMLYEKKEGQRNIAWGDAARREEG